MKTIEIVIDTAGEARLQTRGYSGASCRDASKLLEQALGIVQSDMPTSEMHEAEALPQQVRQ